MTKEDRKEYNKAYYLRHREEILLDAKEKYQHNEDYRRNKIDSALIYVANNREKVEKQHLLYYQQNKDKLSKYNKRYYIENGIRIKRKKQRRKEKIITQENCV